MRLTARGRGGSDADGCRAVGHACEALISHCTTILGKASSMKTSLKRWMLVVAAMGFIALVSTGCQTTKGFGRDVEHVGEKIQGDK
jgi:predicted small secreted protein